MRKLFVSTLCLVLLVAGFSWLGIQLAGYQRQQIALALAGRIQSGNEAEAVAAIGELTGLNELGIPTLVAVAGSSRPRVAPAARWAVEDLLSKWRDDSSKNAKYHAQRLTMLANEMAIQVSHCSPEGQLWLRGIASDILLAAGEISSGSGPLLVAHCDTVFRETSDIQPLSSTKAAAPEQTKPVVNERLAALPPVIKQLPSARSVESLPPVPNPPAATPFVNTVPTATEENHSGNALRQRPHEPHEPQLTAVDKTNEYIGSTPATRAIVPLPFRKPQSRKQESKLDKIPSINSAQQVPPKLEASEKPRLPLGQHAALVRELTSLRSDQVLLRLVHSSAVDQPVIEGELRSRGLDKIPLPLARMLISKEPIERIRGVDTMLRTPNVRPGPWLALMAEDASAEVRLVVVGLLSTSEDPELLERAWQIALHDQDPRVARFTRTIQAKRDGANRR